MVGDIVYKWLVFTVLLAMFAPSFVLAEFYPLRDVNPGPGNFRATVGAFGEKEGTVGSLGDTYRVERFLLRKAEYDGHPGINRIRVKRISQNEQEPYEPGEEKKLLDIRLKGQYYLFGYDTDKTAVYAYRHAQLGAVSAIKNIVMFFPNHPNGQTIGPKGAYQYASCSPNGQHCIMVGSIEGKVKVVDLRANRWKTLGFKVPQFAADPLRLGDEWGGTIGGSGDNLTGQYLMMVWDSMLSGKLIMRDVRGLLVKEFPVKIDILASEADKSAVPSQ